MSSGSPPEFQFDGSQYERPNQAWICGRAAEGQACPLGPGEHGECRATYECVPYLKDDRWMCTRSSSRGGKCEAGPLPDGTCCQRLTPCRPVRSVLARRKVVAQFTFALALGCALIMMAVPGRTTIISPGDLTSSHRAIQDGCAACHAVGRGELRDWVHAAFTADSVPNQSEQCLSCHSNLRENVLNPHNQSPEATAAITLRTLSAGPSREEPLLLTAARRIPGGSAGEHRALACAACHHEHRGKEFDLTAMSDLQCQSCHSGAFHSFSQGHPEFIGYPYARRSHLYFDHVSHYGNHFQDYRRTRPGGPSTRACKDCHAPDAAGKSMLVRGFETACGDCHRSQIEDDTTPGVALFALPALDLQTLHARNTKIGEWPEVYPAHIQAGSELPPLMRLLLRADQQFAAAEANLQEVDLSNLSDANPEQLKSVEGYARSIKKLLHEIVTIGHTALRQRLAAVLGPKITESELSDLVGQAPLRIFLVAQQRWLPNLPSEFQSGQSADAAAPSTEAPPQDETEFESDMGAKVVSGWYLRDVDLSLRYRPAGHADGFLRAWLEVSAQHVQGLPPARTSPPLPPVFDDIFASLAKPSADGRCMKCHTADSRPSQGVAINWLGKRSSVGDRSFTNFDHRPHVHLFEDETCLQCHALKQTSASSRQWGLFRPEFIRADWSLGTDPHHFEPNFAPLSKAQCANCHVRNAARDSCLMCHHYHVFGSPAGSEPGK